MLSHVRSFKPSSLFNFSRFFSEAAKSSDEVIFQAAEKCVIEKVRPFVQSHHGHVSLKSVKDGVLYINLSGNCNDCENKVDTCLDGILEMVQNDVPDAKGIKEVVD